METMTSVIVADRIVNHLIKTKESRLFNTSSTGPALQRNCLIFTSRGDHQDDQIPYVHIEEDSVQIETDSTFECIHEVFESLQRKNQNQPHHYHLKMMQFTKLVFVNHTFTHIPWNIANVLPNIQDLTITSCPNYRDMDSSVRLFPKLQQINFIKCPSLQSLNSLSRIPPESNLRIFVFDMCGLRVTNKDDWSDGFKAIGKIRVSRNHELEMVPSPRRPSKFSSSSKISKGSYISLTIGSCDKLQSIPSSIGYLKDIPLRIDITFNPRLRRLPPNLGDLANLQSLICRVSKYIHKESLPWSMGRLPPNIPIWLPNKDGILTIGDLGPAFRESRKRFFRGLVHLKVVLDRFCRRMREEKRYRKSASYEEQVEDLCLIVNEVHIECVHTSRRCGENMKMVKKK